MAKPQEALSTGRRDVAAGGRWRLPGESCCWRWLAHAVRESQVSYERGFIGWDSSQPPGLDCL